jgi:hypothetical protein
VKGGNGIKKNQRKDKMNLGKIDYRMKEEEK